MGGDEGSGGVVDEGRELDGDVLWASSCVGARVRMRGDGWGWQWCERRVRRGGMGETHAFLQRHPEYLRGVLSFRVWCSEAFRPANELSVVDTVLTVRRKGKREWQG